MFAMDVNQSNIGAIPPPPGITPSFTNPNYISGGIVPISAIFLSLSTILSAFRLYTKLRIVPPFRADDYIMITAWLCSAACTGTAIERQSTGTGKHLWDIRLDALAGYGEWDLASEILYIPATALPKVAILISYLRIFTDKSSRLAGYTVLCITFGYMIAFCLVFAFHCQPTAKSWNLALPGHCILLLPYLWNSILNVATDCMVLFLPIPMLLRWKAPTRRKLATGGVFATGTLTCILSAVRTYFVWRIQYTTDISRAIAIPVSLSVAEANLAVICGCLMVVRPFLRKHLPFTFGSERKHVGRVGQSWPHIINHERQSIVLKTSFEYRSKRRAGFGGINSSAGWIWDREKGINSHAIFGTAGEVVRKESARGWPLRNDFSPRRDTQDNIIEEMGRSIE